MYAIHFPSGETDGCTSVNSVARMGRGVRSPVSGKSQMSPEPEGGTSTNTMPLPSAVAARAFCVPGRASRRSATPLPSAICQYRSPPRAKTTWVPSALHTAAVPPPKVSRCRVVARRSNTRSSLA